LAVGHFGGTTLRTRGRKTVLKVVVTVPWRANVYPIAVAELKSASQDLAKHLTEDERSRLIDFLAFNPEGGEVLPGTGGVRKTRWRYKENGRSRRIRILYYFHDLNMPLYVLAAYGRGEVLRLTKREEQEMRRLVNTLVKENAERNRTHHAIRDLA
jgi:hypothetical protein